MRKINRSKKNILRICIITLLLLAVAGYIIGSGFVDYALLRESPEDPASIPEAAAAIVEPGLDAPAKPQAENEQWTITSQDGLKLVATHFSPKEPSSRWVILVHDFGCSSSAQCSKYRSAHAVYTWRCR